MTNEPYNKVFVPPHKGDKNPNPKLLKLCKKITDVTKHKLMGVTTEDPEYYGLAEILTDEMVDVADKMKVRTPYTLEEMMKLCEVKEEDKEKFEKLLFDMSYVGLLEYDYGYHYDHNGRTAPQSERRYILPMFVPGSAELFNMEELPNGDNPRLKDHPTVADFFERMTFIPLAGITQLIPEGGAGVGMHVIPVEKAISMENKSVDIEHLSYWLKKYEGHIGVGRCSCRASRKVIGDGCADDDWAWCIGVGDFADYCRETGKGHDITYEEAMQILKNGEDNGFVHQITNIDGENKIFGICNCNVEICNALRTSQYFNTPNLSASAYRAHVDKSKCVACGKCVEHCPAGALKLGQKLCTKNGEIEYPRQPLPDALSWGEDRWNPNYRDDNRINTHKTGTAPCKSACPAHIAVQGYLKKAAEGKYTEALALIKKDNPLPAICGRICNRKCEVACTRGTIDEAIAIDEVKKFIAQQDLDAATRYIPPVVIASNRYERWSEKIAIIGAGPAGLSCAYYLASIGYLPTIFEKNENPGGMLRYGIPSYKLDKKVIEAEIEVIKALGVEIKCGVEVGKDVTIQQLREQGYKAFYVAIGCQAGRLPNVPNEKADGCMTALDFLKVANCGGYPVSGDSVVVGGGNVAIDAARCSARNGANHVTMLCLETAETMPASQEEIVEAKEDGVEIKCGWGPKEVLVDENNHVKGIIFKKCTSTTDENGKFNPQYDENETIEIACSNVVFAIGQAINYNGLFDGENIEYWHGNYPVADKFTYQTAVKDIFVGGDVYTGPSFAIDAIAAGHVAAESLHRYVHDGHMEIGRNRRQFIELDKSNLAIESYDNTARQIPFKNSAVDPKGFEETLAVFTEEQVKKETARCLGCGACIVDPNKCIGCGVCTTKCMFDAITLHRDHPNASKMIKAEDKFKAILPYAAKRAIKIAFNSKKE